MSMIVVHLGELVFLARLHHFTQMNHKWAINGLEISYSHNHCVKSVRIRNYSGPYFPTIVLNLGISPYSVRMRENKDQNNSEHGRFLRSEQFGTGQVLDERHLNIKHLKSRNYKASL